MNRLIITTKQSAVRQFIDYLTTIVLWAVFVFFLMVFINDILTGYFLESEVRARLQLYFFLAAVNAIILIVWAVGNMLFFHKKRPKEAINYTSQQFSNSLKISEETYQKMQDAKNLHVYFNEHGKIKNVMS